MGIRAGRIAAGVAVASAMASFAACGLDESGLLPPDGSITGDATADASSDAVSDVPFETIQGCQTVDASACIDADIPDGWTLVALAPSVVTCPALFNGQQLVHALQLEAGACTCGCTPTGRYSCAGAMVYGSSCGSCGSNNVSSCSNTASFDAGDDAQCFPSSINNSDIGFGAQPSVTSLGADCGASVSGQGFSSSPVTVCAPQCTADYCAATGFKRCIVSTATTCPAPFTALEDTVGPLGAVAVTCAGCSCEAHQLGSCGASIAYYSNGNCTAPPLGTTGPSSCNTTGPTNVGSFHYAPTEPTVSCTPSAGDGSVGFTSAALTICCVN